MFGPPPLIEGEDAAAYDQLLARICAAVKPVDIIDEIFIADVVPSEWEVLRLRRLKWSLIRAPALEALEHVLDDYDLSSEERKAKELVQEYVRLEPDAAVSEKERLRAEYDTAFLNPYRAAELGLVDEVIEPASTRAVLCDALDVLAMKQDRQPPRRHSNTPL